MGNQAKDRLESEAARFRAWAGALAGEERSAEWECDYPDWPDIYEAVGAFAAAHAPGTWSRLEVEEVLYLIARDNECEHLASTLASDPERLLFLATESLRASEPDARWQLAVELGQLRRHDAEAERRLVRFASDEDEYVRRRALMALGNLGSPLVERLAESAWSSGLEHQRMAVLTALQDVKSSQLEHYLAEADADGRQYLAAHAAKVRAGTSA